MSKSQNYILNVNTAAQKRLELQHQLFEKSSHQLLLQAGLKSGMRVLEVGCGVGSMTHWLAKQVGTTGHVTAVDISQKQLQAAKTKTDQLGLHNITYIEKNIQEIDQLNDSFDLAYGRMILHHVPKPQLVLKKIIQKLKSKGILVCEEPPAIEGMFCYPASPILEQIIKLAIQGFKAVDCQYDLGYQLGKLFAEFNLQNIYFSFFQPLLSTLAERNILHMGIKEFSPKAIELKLITASEMEKLLENLKQLLQTATTLSYMRMFQAIGIKP